MLRAHPTTNKWCVSVVAPITMCRSDAWRSEDEKFWSEIGYYKNSELCVSCFSIKGNVPRVDATDVIIMLRHFVETRSANCKLIQSDPSLSSQENEDGDTLCTVRGHCDCHLGFHYSLVVDLSVIWFICQSSVLSVSYLVYCQSSGLSFSHLVYLSVILPQWVLRQWDLCSSLPFLRVNRYLAETGESNEPWLPKLFIFASWNNSLQRVREWIKFVRRITNSTCKPVFSPVSS